MRFGPVAPADAIGGVVVHTIRRGKLILKKGTVIGPVEVEALAAAGVNQVVIAALDKGDVSEDVAAATIAEAVAGDGVTVERAFTGRVQPVRGTSGRAGGRPRGRSMASIASMKRSRLRRCRRSSRVVTGEMIGTVKIIPFGGRGRVARPCASHPRATASCVSRHIASRKVGIVSTLLPGLAPKVIEKTLQVTAERLAPAGAKIIAETRVAA